MEIRGDPRKLMAARTHGTYGDYLPHLGWKGTLRPRALPALAAAVAGTPPERRALVVAEAGPVARRHAMAKGLRPRREHHLHGSGPNRSATIFLTRHALSGP